MSRTTSLLQLCVRPAWPGVLACLFTAWLAGAAPALEAKKAGRNGLPWPEPDAKQVEKFEADLRSELKGANFSFSRVGPWIIATDLTQEENATFVNGTISRFAADIQRQLFTKQPRSKPIKVYLFANEQSYNAWNQKLFGSKPHTPYGYYSEVRSALVMNIGTGGGTLLHEMVHAMTEQDFPGIPAWLNEGLGSLFEASARDRESGKVIGVANWRLPGLQKALNDGYAPHLKDLLTLTDGQFYDERASGANYAAARYLMQYLQEQGKLESFYMRVRDKEDKDALASLRHVFGDKQTVEQIEKEFYAWVKALKRRY